MHILKSDDDSSIDHFGLGIVGLTKAESEPFATLANREYEEGSVSRIAQSHLATADQFPCIYREEMLAEVPCQTCGQKNMTAKLYGCSLHEKCTVGQHGVTHDGSNATARVKVCLSCDDRNEVG